MAISIKLKRRWDEYPALQDVLTATKNLSVSPFGLTGGGLQDFRGIKPIGKIEEVSTPARGGTRRITKNRNIHTSLSYTDFSGSLRQDFGVEEADDFTAVIRHVIFDESVDNRMDRVDFSKADIIMCNFWSFCYLDKVKPSKNNCVFKVTDEFYDCLLATIKSSN